MFAVCIDLVRFLFRYFIMCLVRDVFHYVRSFLCQCVFSFIIYV